MIQSNMVGTWGTPLLSPFSRSLLPKVSERKAGTGRKEVHHLKGSVDPPLDWNNSVLKQQKTEKGTRVQPQEVASSDPATVLI